MADLFSKHWNRLKRSLGRRLAEARLPRGYKRLGTRYGGWWIDTSALPEEPFLVDCGLGEDISFPVEFIGKYGGLVVGIDPNPKSIRYCEEKAPAGMVIRQQAMWTEAGSKIEFFPPEDQALVSGSVRADHHYAGNEKFLVRTTSYREILDEFSRSGCDICKLDIEGAEYDVLSDLCKTGEIKSINQLLVEYHHFCTDFSIGETDRSVQMICDQGFELVYVEGRNYIFRKK